MAIIKLPVSSYTLAAWVVTLQLAVVVVSSQSDIPAIPPNRFKKWGALDTQTRSSAKFLMYTANTWNVPLSSPLEHLSYSQVAEFLGLKDASNAENWKKINNALQRVATDSKTWDCWINHYTANSWQVLKDEHNVTWAFEALGWTEETWKSSDPDDWPESEFKVYQDLTETERTGADRICCPAEIWDGIPLTEWTFDNNGMSRMEDNFEAIHFRSDSHSTPPPTAFPTGASTTMAPQKIRSTASPTVAPTSPPTTTPTVAPTPFPSLAPTTSEPTPEDSLEPSTSSFPSSTPSERPSWSLSPSEGPTKSPSSSPSFGPSAAPSTSPTRAPSSQPSISASPTIAPSSIPTDTSLPSLSPSAFPTFAPSPYPSKSPSMGPTASPSEGPSVPPTISPSEAPTNRPSASPTQTPSGLPTISPSAIPSASPTTELEACFLTFTLVLTMDKYPEETFWSLTQESTTAVVAEKNNYQIPFADVEEYVCVLRNECYLFEINDQWNDGMCCKNGNGSYSGYIEDHHRGSSSTFISGLSGGAFESKRQHRFCLDETGAILAEEGGMNGRAIGVRFNGGTRNLRHNK